MSTDTSLAATMAAQAANPDPRDRDPSWVRINGAYHQLAPPSDDPAQPAPVLDYDTLVVLATGQRTNDVAISWRRYNVGDDERSPSDYGLLTLTSGPLLRKPGYRFTVTRRG